MGATKHKAEPDPPSRPEVALVPPVSDGALADQPAELSAQIVKSPMAYIRKHHSEDALTSLATRAGTTVETLERVGGWLSVQQVTRFLEGVQELLGDDRRFREACGYGLWDSYGGMMLLVRAAATPSLLYRVMAKTMHHVSHVSSYAAEAVTRTSVRMRYRSKSSDETRLLCLSRQAQIVQGPVPWGLPPASIEETHCIAWGDDCCCYELKWDELVRRRVLVGAAGVATAAAVAAVATGLTSIGTAALGAVAVMLFMVAYELYHLNSSNSRQRSKAQQIYEDTWAQYDRTMHELLDLHEDQRRWNDDLERRIEDRTQALQGVVRQLEGHHQQDKSAVLSMSHDAINSLTAVKVTAELLVENPDDPYRDQLLADMLSSVGTLDQLFSELMHVASAGAAPAKLNLQRLVIEGLVARAKRRLEALLMGKDIRASVFRTREAPESLVTDVATLHRILDNLLTNACRYTSRGSIILEVDGVPDYLCLKLSDTGKGIAPTRIEAVLSATSGPDPEADLGTSHGIGLSNVVRLLDRLGGRLEVLSRDGVGTTFWVYVPKKPTIENTRPSIDSIETIMRRVVKIRPSLN